MANTFTNDGQLTETTNNTSTLWPPIPIQLSGFLTGDNIQIQGDTQNLQFSVQLNIHHKYNSDPHFNQETTTLQTSSNSSYVTPATNQDVENHNLVLHDTNNWTPTTPQNNNHVEPLCNLIDWTPTNPQDCEMKYEETPQNQSLTNEDENHGEQLRNLIDWTPTNAQDCEVKNEEATIVTRLRSGVLSPVTYYPRSIVDSSKHGLNKRRGLMDVLERVLKRHSLPIRPCNAYSFFVMANWDLVDSSSFGDRNKRLGDMWRKLPQSERKVFEDMASKDHERYKKQCMKLMSKKKRNKGVKCFRG